MALTNKMYQMWATARILVLLVTLFNVKNKLIVCVFYLLIFAS